MSIETDNAAPTPDCMALFFIGPLVSSRLRRASRALSTGLSDSPIGASPPARISIVAAMPCMTERCLPPAFDDALWVHTSRRKYEVAPLALSCFFSSSARTPGHVGFGHTFSGHPVPASLHRARAADDVALLARRPPGRAA
ncbi:hypothetical protein [Acidovorax cavernicola]|uniref:hypothetical protein n=1 Tax=Acidovorax cavernicola TaxID=1675792 RepID=UPI00142DAD5E|nr:hypothetical protein [Acidovorax cavernicola]